MTRGSHDANDWLGGVQAGCNYQVGGFVFGIQGDYAWTDADGTHTAAGFIATTDHSRVRDLSSVTGRVGFAWDRFLGYVKGGGAWEADEYHLSVAGATVASASETRSGWTVGVGGEYAFTPNWTAFVEYNYYDFGDRNLTFTNGAVVNIDERKSVVKGGINFKFDWGPLGRF